jgi:hypothetical protein
LKHSFRLDGKADRYFGRPVKNFKDVTTQQAPVLALGAPTGYQFDPAVAGLAFGTGDIAFFHQSHMRPASGYARPARIAFLHLCTM